jgi:glycerol-3-phosphate cytidylyltransferase
MKKVITYGTFDLLHHGHLNILQEAKKLGDYLIVGVTGESYDKGRGKLNVLKSTLERVEDIRSLGLADEIIIEEYEGQKIDDIQKFNVDIFCIGSDWRGKFDYLNEFCEVVYIERTKGISSTQIRGQINKIIKIGVIGSGRIANRFIPESKFVSGLNVRGVFNPARNSASEFCARHELEFFTDNLDSFLSKVDAVYIASPHKTHLDYINLSLDKGLHVLCESPLVLDASDAKSVFEKASSKGLVLMEAIKTAYTPAFNLLISVIKSGVIGSIKHVDASLTKLTTENSRELSSDEEGGSITEMVTYPLLPIIKLLGIDYEDIIFYSWIKNDVDLFTKGLVLYKNAIASFKVGLGIKSEGDLIISGTKGYAYVPAPWWKTEYFEIRFEDQNKNSKYFSKLEGDGLRYEINHFIQMINNPHRNYNKMNKEESIVIANIIDKFRKGYNVKLL